MLVDGAVPVDARGVFASIAAMAMSSAGYVLAKKWSAGIDVFSLTAWQFIAGGAVLTPVAVAVEGSPPAMDTRTVVGFGYVTIAATALAFAVWFTGLRHLSAGTVGLIGLLNPVTGVLLGTAIAGETLVAHQICGLVLVLFGILLGQPVAARLFLDQAAAPAAEGEAITSNASPIDRHFSGDGRREELQCHVVGVLEGQSGPVVRVDDAAVRDAELIEALLPALELVPVDTREGHVVQARRRGSNRAAAAPSGK